MKIWIYKISHTHETAAFSTKEKALEYIYYWHIKNLDDVKILSESGICFPFDDIKNFITLESFDLDAGYQYIEKSEKLKQLMGAL